MLVGYRDRGIDIYISIKIYIYSNPPPRDPSRAISTSPCIFAFW